MNMYIIYVNGEEVAELDNKEQAEKEAKAWEKANPDYPVEIRRN